jgi:ABC-type Mn2+/Zn2+ transport system permease subunit
VQPAAGSVDDAAGCSAREPTGALPIPYRDRTMDWLTEPFRLGLQQKALIAGLLAATACALVGTWVVIRGMSFLGDALVHGVIPGIALAVLLGFDPSLGAVAAAIVMIAGINLVHRQTTFSEDTGIGLLFVGMLGLGVIIISKAPSYRGSLTSILFGDALGVTDGDIRLLLAATGVVALVSAAMYRHFLVLSFNEAKTRLYGLRPGVAHFVLLGMVTLAIVASFRTVGTLLVFGLLIGPPATATLLVRRVPTMMITATIIGTLSVVAGLIISYHLDIAASATMAVVPVALFFTVLTARIVLDRLRRRAAGAGRPA